MLKIAGHYKSPLQDITQHLIAGELGLYDQELSYALAPQEGYLSETEMSLYRKGKKLRPIILLLSARLFQPHSPLPRKVIRASVSLEMMHIATLIHDDIVDHATLRRGVESVNAARGTEMAVLIGDMQFLQSVRCFVDAIEDDNDIDLVKWVLDTAFSICQGEIDEMNTNSTWSGDMLYARYLTTIGRKTAILFSLASESGAALMRARTSEMRRLGIFGRHLGMAFQMMDDIFDLSHSSEEAGKHQGLDLHQRRLTLPIIKAMTLWGDDHPMVHYLRGAEASENQIEQWVRDIRYSDAFGLSYKEARKTALEAVSMLESFAPSPYRQALENIAMSVVNRSYKTTK